MHATKRDVTGPAAKVRFQNVSCDIDSDIRESMSLVHPDNHHHRSAPQLSKSASATSLARRPPSDGSRNAWEAHVRSQHAVSQALLHELHVLRSTASLRPWAQVDRVLKSSVDFGRTSSSNQLGWQRSYGMQYRAAPMQRSAKDGALGHSASSRKAQMRRLALATELDAGNYLSRLQKERDTRDALRQESRLRPESIFKAYRNDEPPDARVTSHRRPQSPVRRAAPRAATKPWETREAAVAAAADRAEHPEATHKQQQQQESQEERREREKIIQMATDSLNSRFATGNMFKAFQSIDLDRNGRLSPVEIRRALELWNLPIDE
jgi:hypothetical protein